MIASHINSEQIQKNIFMLLRFRTNMLLCKMPAISINRKVIEWT